MLASICLPLFLVFLVAPSMQEGASERAARLRAQLSDIQAQQTELQARLDQINEDIKPENIERSLAGVGSTHPEDLREARRRQLETQRKGIQNQLDNLTATRARLESAIAASDAQTYRAIVGPNTAPNTVSNTVSTPASDTTSPPTSNKPVSKKAVRRKHRSRRHKLHKTTA